MDELSVIDKLKEIEESPQYIISISEGTEQERKIAQHKEWLKSIRHEHPNPNTKYKVGIYIRYFNQTKYDNYIEYHKKQFSDTISLCPNWELVGFYIDEGSTAPNMESAPEWSRLLIDCMDGKVNLIITQKVSNVSKKMQEITLCARILATQNPPVGMYFVSEDIFTLASYYQEDLRDPFFLYSCDEKLLSEASEAEGEDEE